MLHLVKHKGRNKTLTVPFLVDLYHKQNGRCAITNLPMTRKFGGGRCMTNISIDRIDSSEGYTPDNVQLVLLVVNLMKLDMSEAEVTTMALFIVTKRFDVMISEELTRKLLGEELFDKRYKEAA